MPTYRYTLTNSHSATGLTGDHYHSIEVSSLNAGVKANIPQYSKISSIYLYCSAKTSISSKADAWWYFGNSSPYRDGYKICGGTEIIGTSNATISGNIPASMYTSSASNSGTLLTQYSRLAITMTATIVRKFTCNSAYVEWTYTLPTYTINLSANGGGTVSGGGTHEITQFNDQITSGGSWTFKAKANSGYRFVGWRRVGFTGYISYDETYTYTRSSIYSNAITESIEGVFVKTYTVNYNGNGATDGAVASQTVDFGSNLTLRNNNYDKSYVVTLDNNYDPTQQRDSFTSTAFFLGWEDRTGITSSSGRAFSYTEFDAPYYANTYSDLYAAFGYNKLSLVDHYVNNGEREGRNCIGATRGTYPAGAVVNSLTTTAGGTAELYAQWTNMTSIPLPSRTRKGYTFLGWFTEPTGGTRIGGGGDIYTPTGDILLYAHWQADSSFLYIKKDGSFVGAKKVYIKKNGAWVEVADKSEINTDVKYTIKSV